MKRVLPRSKGGQPCAVRLRLSRPLQIFLTSNLCCRVPWFHPPICSQPDRKAVLKLVAVTLTDKREHPWFLCIDTFPVHTLIY